MLNSLNVIKKLRKSKSDASLTAAPTIEPTSTFAVSDGNPCLFLRGLVGAGIIDNGEIPINQLLDAIDTMVATRDNGTPGLPRTGLRGVALTANGLSPFQVAHNTRHGVNLDKLREGPYYKHGVHSRTLAETGGVNQDQFLRLSGFGSPKVDRDGKVELGLNGAEIKRMVRANFLRGAYAGHHRSPTDIPIMKAEYPILLQIMGKQGQHERYLSVNELSNLLFHNQFPERMLSRLKDNASVSKKCPYHK